MRPLSEEILKGKIKSDSVVKVKFRKGADGFTFSTSKKESSSKKDKKGDSTEIIEESKEDNT